MLGDPSWLEELRHGYNQHLADSVRYERPSKSFDEWAIDRTWDRFVTTARFAMNIPEYALSEWATSNPLAGHTKPKSVVLARRCLDALVMVEQLIRDMHQYDRWLGKKMRIYLRYKRGTGSLGSWAKDARRYVFDWLVERARTEERIGV